MVGVGAAGLAVSGVYGWKAHAAYQDSLPYCDGRSCDETGFSLDQKARDHARVSTFAFSVGLALVAGGGALWIFSSPDRPPTTLSLGSGANGLSANLQGAWE